MFWKKLTVTLSVKKFPVFYGTEVSLPYSKYLGTEPMLRYLNNFTSSPLVSLRSVLILSCFLWFGLLDCPFRFSAGCFESLKFKIWKTPGVKYQYGIEERYPSFPVSHHFWNSLCHDCLSSFLNETCVNSSTIFRNLLTNKFNTNCRIV
jgi:hypothetical protein